MFDAHLLSCDIYLEIKFFLKDIKLLRNSHKFPKNPPHSTLSIEKFTR